MQHLLLDTWGYIKPFIRFDFELFGIGYILMFLNVYKSIPNVYSRIVGDEELRNNFSWLISSLFAILHIDISLMKVICDMSQFISVVPVSDESSATLDFYSMQHVLLKFGLCYFVVLDDCIPFKGAFIAMCEALYLIHDILENRNHKGLTVEYFHCFLNKSVTIVAEERGNNDSPPLAS